MEESPAQNAPWDQIREVLRRAKIDPMWANLLDSGGQLRRNFEETVGSQSYFEFLEEQIALGARGPEWNQVLQVRRDRYWPFVGRMLWYVTLVGAGRRLMAWIDPAQQRLIHHEDESYGIELESSA